MNAPGAVTALADATWAAYQQYATTEQAADGPAGLLRYWLGVSRFLTGEIDRLEDAVQDLYGDAEIGTAGYGAWGTAALHLDAYKAVRHEVTRYIERLSGPQAPEEVEGWRT
jgi:hypothetical protein